LLAWVKVFEMDIDLYKGRRKILYQKPIPIDARAPEGSPWQSF
jgi:hypothetical protein